MMGVWSLIFFCLCIALALWVVNRTIPMMVPIRILLNTMISGIIVWWILHLLSYPG